MVTDLAEKPSLNGPNRMPVAGHRNGFALIVTISLMVLLVVIGLGLLSLSVIALRSQRVTGASSVARANARLALLIAIGDLQRAAGPDQRVTATADIAGADDGTPVGAAQNPVNSLALDGTEIGLSSVQSGTRYWTGVFSNRDDPNQIYKKTPAARIERWLVSGSQDPAANSPTITPAHEACAVGSNGSVSDNTKAAVLVGPNTVGTGSDSQDQYVAAPMVAMDSSAIGGLKGGFAYWIGDEGVKARINMARENDELDSYHSLVAQRRGWETVDGFADYPTPAGDADRQLPGIVTLPTSEVLIPSLRGGDPSPRQSVFHSATTESRGLVVDTLNGGTRVDLTAAFSQGLPNSMPPGAYDNYPVSGGRVIPTQAASRLRHLNWDHLEDFYKRGTSLSGDRLKVSERTGPANAAIAPIITDFRILMGVRLKADSDRGRDTGRYKPSACGQFAVTIANPYSVPLEWDRDLEFEIKNMTPYPNRNRPSRIWQIQSCVYIPRDGSLDRPGREPAVFNQALFRIGKDRLKPGEARAYTISGRILRTTRNANRPMVVTLSPVSRAAASFNNCVEMETDTTITLPKTMDVRESWQTTLVALEMRLSGSRGRYTWLRRMEGFELDNGYFSPNQRRFLSTDAPYFRRGPIALMLYSFQISQPGIDYLAEDLMPRGYEMGQRSSTLRTFADFNLQATNIHKPITSYNPPPYFMESNDNKNQLGGSLIRDAAGRVGPGFTRNMFTNPLYWGRSPKSGSTRTVLFSIPRQFSSLAQFQHADLTNDDLALSVGHQPGNAVGNSYATPFVKRTSIEQRRTDYVLQGSQNPRGGADQNPRTYYDISHILNNSLWDRYFFSTIPSSGSTPENPTLFVAPGTGNVDFGNPAESASGLMIDGAFNINSTDKNAWKAFLASAKYLDHSADRGSISEAAFPRSLEQPEPSDIPPSGDHNDSFSGYRRLTDEELENLAIEIVRQVRLRGPFVSLSHFVNRALADINKERELTRCGALQFALDESGINISHDGRRNGFRNIEAESSGRWHGDRVTLAEKQGAPRADLDGGDLSDRPTDVDRRNPDWAMTSRDNNFGAVASIIADREMLLDSDMRDEQGYRSTGIPGWVTQADVLQVIGPAISARSDTFRIRTCGQARNKDGKVIATAYAEAIVQRQPGFVDPANRPHDRVDVLNETNLTYGRRFEIVSFRWLSSQEI